MAMPTDLVHQPVPQPPLAPQDYYPHLLLKCKSAMVSAVEMYNKPRFDYREESCTMLIVNAWDLALKALLTKHGASFFEESRRQPPAAIRRAQAPASHSEYRASAPVARRMNTLSCLRAFDKVVAEEYWPQQLPTLPVKHNLRLLSTYRDDVVHYFVDSRELASILYCLAQANVMNFRDLLKAGFEEDFEKDFNWHIAPLRSSPPPVPIKYVRERGLPDELFLKSPTAVAFVRDLRDTIDLVSKSGEDVERLLTHYSHTVADADRSTLHQ